MQTEGKSIVLISKNPDISALVESVVQFRPETVLKRCDATLSEMNGTASELALSNDLVIFCPEGDTDRDVAAVRDIRSRVQSGARVIALADARTPFADMRRLSEAGVNDVLPDNLTPDELAGTLWKAMDSGTAQDTAAERGSRNGMVIPVTHARGGAGATTVAVNLADSLTQRSGFRTKTAASKVALVDLDLQFGAVSSFLDLQPGRCLYQMADEGLVPDATFLQQSMLEAGPGLWVLPAPAEFAPLHMLEAPQIQALITQLRARFDYVVVDLPRVLVEWLSPVLEASERLVMVTDCSVPSIAQAQRLMKFYGGVNVGLEVDVVINRKRKPMFAASHEKEASRVLQRPFDHWLADDPAAALAAADQGVPLSAAASRSALTKGIRRLAADMIDARQAQSATVN